MTVLFESERFKRIKEGIDKAWTTTQKRTRMEIAYRFEKVFRESNSDEEFYAKAWADFPVWCLAFIDDDKGKPLFLAKWQIEFAEMIGGDWYTWALNSRKCGKSTLLALKIAHFLCGSEKHRISGFAPTHGQDFVYDKTRKYIKASTYLYDTFLNKNKGANDTADAILTSTGCEFLNRSISVNTGGSTARGEYGDIIYVDEIQEIDQTIMDTIVFPMLADMYSEKKLILIGTPNVYKNPHLERRWDEWGALQDRNPKYKKYRVDCWRAIDEGCLDEAWVLKQKAEMTPDDFAMEYEAKFPDTSLRFFPLTVLENLRSSAHFLPGPRPGYTYIMSVDWAKYLNKTQIIVGEVDMKNKTLTYCDWIMFDPRERVVDYEIQAESVKELFWRYNVSWFIPDTTSTQDMILNILFRDSNYPAIPRGRVYRENENQEIWGYKANGPLNDKMWRNHKQQMVKGRIICPTGIEGAREWRFFDRYEREHHELVVKTGQGGLLRMEEPRGGDKDMAVAAAMMSIYLERMDRTPPSFHIGAF